MAEAVTQLRLAAPHPDRPWPDGSLGRGQATPPLDAPVVAWARVRFHTPRPPARSLPSMDPCGKADRPMPEASGNVAGLATAERFSTCRPRGDGIREPFSARGLIRASRMPTP